MSWRRWLRRKEIPRPNRDPRDDAQFASFRFFEHGFRTHDDDDALFRDAVTRAVGLDIETDDGAFRQADVAVDDGAPDTAMPSDIHVIEDDGFFDVAVAVDAHVISQHAALYAASGNN